MASHYEYPDKTFKINLELDVIVKAVGGSKSIWAKEEFEMRVKEMIENGDLAELIKANIKKNLDGFDQTWSPDWGIDNLEYEVK